MSTASSNDRRDTWTAFAASTAIVLIFAVLIWLFFPVGEIETRSGRSQNPVRFVLHYQDILLLSIAGLVAMTIPQQWIRRKRTVSTAGQLLIRPHLAWTWWSRAFYSFWGIVVFAMLVLLWFIDSPVTVAELGKITANLLLFTMAVLTRCLRLSSSTLEIRERGLVWYNGFWRWDQIQDHSWSDGGSKLRLKIRHYGFVNFREDSSRKDEIDQLFLEHRRRAEPAGTS